MQTLVGDDMWPKNIQINFLFIYAILDISHPLHI